MTPFFSNLIIISSLLSLCSSFIIDLNLLELSYSVPKESEEIRQIDIVTSIRGDQIVGNNVTIIARLNEKLDQTIEAQLICEGEKCLKILGSKKFDIQSFETGTEKLEWNLKLNDYGRVNLLIKLIDTKKINETTKINNKHSSQKLKVGKSYVLSTWATIFGYIYFFAWMASLYPILITNFKRKSVIGLNLDFVALNTTGYLSYSIYNICLFYIYDFQEAYFKKFSGSQIPVQFNDVLFACHGFMINVCICAQCIFYERGDQVLTNIAKGLLIAIYSPAIILTLLYILDGIEKYYYISFFSYCKLILTLFKYMPQAYFNYKRKSTDGFSIVYIFLDFTGGLFGILQMIMNSINQDDFHNFTGNAGKVGLGLVSISFDLLFIVQHYYLYRQKKNLILNSHDQGNYGTGSSKKFVLRQNNSENLSIDNLNDYSFNNINNLPDENGIKNQSYVEM